MSGEQFSEGQDVIWTGVSGSFEHPARIAAVRRAYLVIAGQRPEDGEIVYDIDDSVTKGVVYSIPGEQLQAAGFSSPAGN